MLYLRRRAPMPRKKAPSRRRRVVPRLKTGQNSFERSQPTAASTRNAEQVALYKTPLWPASKLIKNQLYYDDNFTLTGISGVMATHVFSANGLYDPDFTGSGHQPIGFDQIISSYNHYSVIRSKITIGFVNNSSYAVRAGIYLSPDGTPITNERQLMENGLVKHVILDAKGGASTDPGVSGRVKTVTLDCDVRKYFGKQRYSQLMEANYTGDAASNPQDGVYFMVFAYSSHTGSANSQVLFDVTLSYDSIYSEPRKLTLS